MWRYLISAFNSIMGTHICCHEWGKWHATFHFQHRYCKLCFYKQEKEI